MHALSTTGTALDRWPFFLPTAPTHRSQARYYREKMRVSGEEGRRAVVEAYIQVGWAGAWGANLGRAVAVGSMEAV